MRCEGFGINQAVRVLQFLLNKIFDHLTVLNLLLLGLTDKLLLGSIIDVPVSGLQILGLLLKLRLGNFLGLESEVHGLSTTLHVGVRADLVGFEFLILLVLSSYRCELLGVILDKLRRNEEQVESVGLAQLDVDDGLDLLFRETLLGLLVGLVLLLLFGFLIFRSF